MGNWHPLHRLTFYALFGCLGSISVVKLLDAAWLATVDRHLPLFASIGYQILWMQIVRAWTESRPPKH